MPDIEGPNEDESRDTGEGEDSAWPVAVTRPPWLTDERMKIGVFAVVTVVVGLVGLAVSATFEPLDRPSFGGTDSIAVDTTRTPTTSTTVSLTSTTAVGPTTTSAVATTPGSLAASTETIDLGEEGIAGQFDLVNDGGASVQWAIASSSEAIALSAEQGELEGGERATVDLSLDREEIEEGDLAETLTVTWDGDTIEIAVVGNHEDNPIIHDPRATPSSVEVAGNEDCTNTRTTVSARIRDTSPLESVVVRWSPDGGGQQETAMTGVGNDMFEAVIGPFTVEQSATVRIVAFDERGNAGGATTAVNVVACP